MLSYSKKRRNKKIAVFLIFIFLVLVFTAYISTHLIRIDQKELKFSSIPNAFNKLKIVFASDFLYNGNNTNLMKSSIAKINSCRADIVILGGNYGNNPKNSLRFFDIIPSIHARLAIVAVLGENDVQDYDKDVLNLRTKLRDKNINLLINSSEKIRVDNQNIFIYGIDDYKKGYPDYNSSNANIKSNDFVVFVSNSSYAINPMLRSMDSSGMLRFKDLSLFGGTLGGEIVGFENIKKTFDPIASPRYTSGWHEEKRNNILISKGIGSKNLFRFLVFPEIHSISLLAR